MKSNLRAHYLLIILSAMTCMIAMTAASSRATTLPPGTQIQVRMNDKLDTGEAQAGQTFSGVIAEPVVVNGRTIIASGTRVSGQISQTISSGRLKKPASITLVL